MIGASVVHLHSSISGYGILDEYRLSSFPTHVAYIDTDGH